MEAQTEAVLGPGGRQVRRAEEAGGEKEPAKATAKVISQHVHGGAAHCAHLCFALVLFSGMMVRVRVRVHTETAFFFHTLIVIFVYKHS